MARTLGLQARMAANRAFLAAIGLKPSAMQVGGVQGCALHIPLTSCPSLAFC